MPSVAMAKSALPVDASSAICVGVPWFMWSATSGYSARNASITGGRAYRAWVCVVAMDRLPRRSLRCSWAACRMFSTSCRMRSALARIASPAGVTRVRCLPLRVKISTPNSSSSRRICLLMPGWDV